MGSHQILLTLLLQHVLVKVKQVSCTVYAYVQIYILVYTHLRISYTHFYLHISYTQHSCALEQDGWLHAALNYVDSVIALSVSKTK